MGGIYVREDVGGSRLTRLDAALIFEALAHGLPVDRGLHLHPQHGRLDDRLPTATTSQRRQWLPELCTHGADRAATA